MRPADTPCNPCAGWGSRVVRIASWNWVTASNAGIEIALQDGPVTSWMAVYSDFYHYRSGVYQPTAGASYEGGHFVVIVGYNHAEQILDLQEFLGNRLGRQRFFPHQMGNCGHRRPGAAHGAAGHGQRAAGAAEHSRLFAAKRDRPWLLP